MSTRMDENTVSANFVTFINCLSYPERKCITEFLFAEALLTKPIESGSKVDWEISYHTNIGDGCEPDITISINQEKYFLEVKTRIGTGLTQTEVKGGARENLFKNNIKKHVYLLPNEYKEKYSDQLIVGCPVITWNELLDEIIKNDIDGQKFFKEIGKYIDCFEQNNTYELTKGDVFMLFKPEEMKATLSLVNKLSWLVLQTKDSIQKELANFKISIGNPTGPLHSFCQISMNNQVIGGYGFNNWIFNIDDNDNTPDYAFSIWFENKNYWNEKDNDKCKLIYDTKLPFYKIDEKVLNGTEEQMKDAFSKEVVKLFKSYLKI